ncbi:MULTISPECIES: Rieske (2Fe-2S) protein [unclassified Streptomyces]|uniref:Rieske (2Fe-2S) protein n=1 Tax=unclassified Streptomyces TaxID=2593676 RepID=UPI003813B852
MTSLPASRRTVLLTSGAAALAVAAVGCGGDDGGGSASDGTPAPKGTPGQELARTADIPVGGGRIFKDEKIVVTQPTEGDFKAFSAVCTHQGCLVGSVADGTVNCPCHGSTFKITDGAVTGGPAPRPLPEEKISVEGGSVRLA